MPLRTRILGLFVVFISLFGYVVISDAVNTYYTEFYFVSGSNFYKSLSVNLTGGETGYATFHLTNKSSSTISINMSFVDSDIINYGTTGVRVCKSENEKDQFGQYVNMTNSSFSLLAGSGFSEDLDLLFPAWYSGVYYGCILYYPNVVDDGGNNLNTLARKAIFLDVNVTPTNSVFEVKIYPGSRGNTIDPNLNGFENRGLLLFYDSEDRSRLLYSGYINDTNNMGTGTYVGTIPSGYYDVVYKGWHHLSSFISGVYITGGQQMVLDFTTGNNLYGVENGLVYGQGSGYQFAGDMFASNNRYDYQINSTDLSVLYGDNCPYGSQVGTPNNSRHECDLNNDGWVDSSDASVIIGHDWYEDAAYGYGGAGFRDFGAVHY